MGSCTAPPRGSRCVDLDIPGRSGGGGAASAAKALAAPDATWATCLDCITGWLTAPVRRLGTDLVGMTPPPPLGYQGALFVGPG